MKCPPQHGLFSSCFQSKSSAHVQHKLSVLWKEYRAGTRSVDGLLRACFLHVGLIFCARRLSVERNSYSDVAGWAGGWAGGCPSQPVLYQND